MKESIPDSSQPQTSHNLSQDKGMRADSQVKREPIFIKGDDERSYSVLEPQIIQTDKLSSKKPVISAE